MFTTDEIIKLEEEQFKERVKKEDKDYCFRSKDLVLEKETFEGKKYFECSICGKVYISARNKRYKIERHCIIHTEEKPHSCQHCQKKFKTPCTRKRHECICKTKRFKQLKEVEQFFIKNYEARKEEDLRFKKGNYI